MMQSEHDNCKESALDYLNDFSTHLSYQSNIMNIMESNGGVAANLTQDMQQQIQILQKENTSLKNRFAELQHIKKKQIIQIKTELQFERDNVANLEQKLKQLLREKEDSTTFKNMSMELTEQLTQKDNEIQELRKANFELKKKITELQSNFEGISPALKQSRSKGAVDPLKQLAQQVKNLQFEKMKIQEGAVLAIMEKDNVINDLEDELRMLKQSTDSYGMAQLVELKERYQELQQKTQKMAKEHEQQAYYKDNEISQLKQRLEVLKTRNDQRAARLENDINQYEAYIERMKQQRVHEDNLVESLDLVQEKNRRLQKQIQQLEYINNELKNNSQNDIRRLEIEVGNLKIKIQTLKVYEQNFSELTKQSDKQRKAKQQQISMILQEKEHLREAKAELINKNMELEVEKKRLQQNLQSYKKQCGQALAEKEKIFEKYSDLKDHFEVKLQQQKQLMIVGKDFNFKSETLIEGQAQTGQHSQNLQTGEPMFKKDTLQEEIDRAELVSSRKRDLQENSMAIETLNRKIAQLEDRVRELEEQLSQKISQIQSQREKALKMSEQYASNQKEQELKIEIEVLKSHLNKVENNLLIVKLKSADDQSFWRDRITAQRKQFAEKESLFIKQKTELYQKIQKLRRSKGQVKSDYYQSSLK